MLDLILNEQADLRPLIRIDYLTVAEQIYISKAITTEECLDSINVETNNNYIVEDKDETADIFSDLNEYSTDDFLNEFKNLMDTSQEDLIVNEISIPDKLPTFKEVCEEQRWVNVLCKDNVLGKMKINAETLNELNHYMWRDWIFESGETIVLTKEYLLKNILIL